MPEPTIRRMFEAGVHFGHQTRFWNPSMAPYIYGERNKIHIINLDTTAVMFKAALDYLQTVAASGGKILFVGTKRAARDSIVKNAERCDMPCVNHRWLGGMLTNFKTVRLSVKRYTELEEEREKGGQVKLSKKQALRRDREIEKLSRNLKGIKDMVRLPDAMFVIDVRHEKIAVNEAVKLGVPVVAVVDTNNSFAGVDYVIPGNDDAIRAVDLYVTAAADAVLEGIEEKEKAQAEAKSKETIEGVIKVPSKEAGAEKSAQPAKGAVKKSDKKSDKKADKKTQSKPKVRMRGLIKKLGESRAKDKDKDKDKDKNKDKAQSKDESSARTAGEDKNKTKTKTEAKAEAKVKTESAAESKDKKDKPEEKQTEKPAADDTAPDNN